MMQDRFLYKAKTTPKGRNNEFSNVWVYGNLIVSGGKVFIHPQCNRVDVKNEVGKLIIMHEVVAETICQCTGLKDKTDTLIWENDIVFLSDEINGFKWQAVVRYGNPNGLYNWGWQLVPIGEDSVNTDILLWIEMDGASAVVIGNVFDKQRIDLYPAQMKLRFEKGLEE